MPATVKDVKDFFDRHPEFASRREKIIEMALGSSFNGVIFPDGIDFSLGNLANQFVEELKCPKI